MNKFSQPSLSDAKVWQEIYQQRMDFMRREYEDQKRIIESYRHKHPDNGIELDAWKERETLLYQRQLQLEKIILELRTLVRVYEQLDKFYENKKNKAP